MVDIIDRIAEFLRDIFGDGDQGSPGPGGPGNSARGTRSGRSVDPDLDQAWQELNDFLGPGDRGSAGGGTGGSRGSRGSAGSGRSGGAPRHPLEALRQDYANLEVPFPSDIETVRRSYKKLMLRYHPDKHGGDPEQLRVATEITKRINESFERIRSFHENRENRG